MSARVRLNPLDAAWVLTESRDTPNHVGGLLTFQLPTGAPRDFLRLLMLEFRTERQFAPPWNRRLDDSVAAKLLPAWVEDDAIDLEYHVRHAALPWPGGERELGELVGRLHSTPIDLRRPPWECTIIEGLEGARFALFVKMHHSLIDGVSGIKLLQRAMSHDVGKSLALPPFWATGSGAAERAARRGSAPSISTDANGATGTSKAQRASLSALAGAFGQILGRIGERGDGLAVPFDAPRSILNGRVREKRRFATQQFALERLRTLAKTADCTLNDIVLALCSGALRRFLIERDSLPEKSLTAGIPMSVRPAGDEGSGNQITFIVATLGTDIDDALERLRAIQASVQHAKAHVQSLPRDVMTQYTSLLMAPTIVGLLTGIGGRMRPMFNITISNVPGPDKPLYFRGAELLAIYPASIVTHGQALNITCQSYAGKLNFGFTGCHTSVPSLQRLAVYAADALAELERAVSPHRRTPRVDRRARAEPTASASAAAAPAAAARKRRSTRRTAAAAA